MEVTFTRKPHADKAFPKLMEACPGPAHVIFLMETAEAGVCIKSNGIFQLGERLDSGWDSLKDFHGEVTLSSEE